MKMLTAFISTLTIASGEVVLVAVVIAVVLLAVLWRISTVIRSDEETSRLALLIEAWRSRSS